MRRAKTQYEAHWIAICSPCFKLNNLNQGLDNKILRKVQWKCRRMCIPSSLRYLCIIYTMTKLKTSLNIGLSRVHPRRSWKQAPRTINWLTNLPLFKGSNWLRRTSTGSPRGPTTIVMDLWAYRSYTRIMPMLPLWATGKSLSHNCCLCLRNSWPRRHPSKRWNLIKLLAPVKYIKEKIKEKDKMKQINLA